MVKRLLSQVYDRRGIPTIFLIFSLVDICGDDLDAIAGIFSNDELSGMNRHGAGTGS